MIKIKFVYSGTNAYSGSPSGPAGHPLDSPLIKGFERHVFWPSVPRKEETVTLRLKVGEAWTPFDFLVTCVRYEERRGDAVLHLAFLGERPEL